MWSGLTQRLKDLAEEITSPQYEDDNDLCNDVPHRMSGGGVPPVAANQNSTPSTRQENSTVTERRLQAEFSAQKDDDDSRAHATLHQDTNPSVNGHEGRRLTWDTAPSAALSRPFNEKHIDVLHTQPSHSLSTGPPSAAVEPMSAAPSLNVASAATHGHSAREVSMRSSSPPLPPHGNEHQESYKSTSHTPRSATRPYPAAVENKGESPGDRDGLVRQIGLLNEQVASLKNELLDSGARLKGYEVEVQQAHESLVHYYEDKLRSSQQAQEAERQRGEEAVRAVQNQVDSLERQLSHAQKECEEAKKNNASLGNSIESQDAIIRGLRDDLEHLQGEHKEKLQLAVSEADKKAKESIESTLQGELVSIRAERSALVAKLESLAEERAALQAKLEDEGQRHEQERFELMEQLRVTLADIGEARQCSGGLTPLALVSTPSIVETVNVGEGPSRTAEASAQTSEPFASTVLEQEVANPQELIARQKLEADAALVNALQVRVDELSAEHQAELQHLEREWQKRLSERESAIQDAQHHAEDTAAQLGKAAADLEHQLQVARQDLQSAQEEAENARSKASSLEQRLDITLAELDTLKQARSEESARVQSEGISITSLLAVKSDLERELSHFRDLVEQLQRTVAECLMRANVAMPSGTLSFSDWVILLTCEFNQLLMATRKAERVQQEWERTYEQARSVNASLNQQVNDAWATIGSLREELSVKSATLSKHLEHTNHSDERVAELQRQLAEALQMVQSLQEEKEDFAQQIQEASREAVSRLEEVAALQHEVQSLRNTVLEREEELTLATRSLDNLQQMMDTLKMHQTRDVEVRTADFQLEMDQLKAQLADAEVHRQKHEQDLQGLLNTHYKELAAKNVEITSLHRKLAEMRKAVEQTARQLSGETMIDKGVISHLIVNYMHAFVGQRPEADAMLKVLSGLLNWDEGMQEKAGLLPGPSNPKPNQRRRRGLLGWASASTRPPPSGATPTINTERTGKQSLASLWVDFLLHESDERGRQSSAASGAVGDGSTSAPVSAGASRIMENGSSEASPGDTVLATSPAEAHIDREGLGSPSGEGKN